MKKGLFYFFIFIFLFLSPLSAQESEGNPQLKAMIADLEKKIEDADKRMVAHPIFLEELRTLVGKYKSQLRELFFKDNFRDGNYTQNPKWIIKSGNFVVTKGKGLSNSVELQTYEPETKTAPKQSLSIEQETVGILLNSIFNSNAEDELVENSPPPSSPKPVQPAYIYTETSFPPAFEMNMRFTSTSLNGEMEIVLLGTKNMVPRYRLSLKIDNSEEKPIEILRESNSRQFVIGAATKFPKINDGKPHTLSWVRYTDGAMHVLIDATIVLQTYEVFYRDSFSGFGIANNGGKYEWNSFKIFKALNKKKK